MNTKKRLFIGLSFALIFGCSTDLTDEEYVSKAQGYIADQDYKSAIIELKSALQQNGRNGDARLLLGEAYLALGDWQAAEKELTVALEITADKARVSPSLALALLRGHKFPEILELEPIRDTGSEAAQSLSVTQGMAMLALGKLTLAENNFSAILEENPNSVYALEGKARLEAVRGDMTASRSTVEKIIALDGQYEPGWSLLGQIEEDRG